MPRKPLALLLSVIFMVILLFAIAPPLGLVIAYGVIGLAVVGLIAIGVFVAQKLGTRSEIAEQWKNPAVRRWCGYGTPSW